MHAGIRRALQHTGTSRHDRIEVAEQHHRNPQVRARHEFKHRVEMDAMRERHLRTGLDDGPVGHRVGKRHADLQHVGAGSLESLPERHAAFRIGMSSGGITDERAATAGPQRFKSGSQHREF